MADRRARVKRGRPALRRTAAEDAREGAGSAPAALDRVLLLRAPGLRGHEPATVRSQDHDHAVGIEAAPGRVAPGRQPYFLEPVHAGGLERVDAGSRLREEAHQVNVELVLGAETRRVHDEGDLPLVSDTRAGRLPSEAPETIRPTPILDSGDGIARHGQSVNETGGAPAHLDVANGHVLLALGPHLRGARARILEVTCSRLRPAALGAVARLLRIETFLDDLTEGIAGGIGRRAARGHHEDEEGESASHGSPRVAGVTPLLGQFASPDLLSPRLAAELLSSNGHVLSRQQCSTYALLSPRLGPAALTSKGHVRLALLAPSGLVFRAEGVARVASWVDVARNLTQYRC